MGWFWWVGARARARACTRTRECNECNVPQNPKRASDPIDLKLKADASNMTWMLRTDASAIYSLNWWFKLHVPRYSFALFSGSLCCWCCCCCCCFFFFFIKNIFFSYTIYPHYIFPSLRFSQFLLPSVPSGCTAFLSLCRAKDRLLKG